MVYIRKFDKEKDIGSFYEMEKGRNISGKLFDAVFEFMMNEMKEKKILRYTIIKEKTEDIVGFCQLDMEDRKRPEVGVDIFEQYWDRGYGTQAVKLLIEHASMWNEIECFRWKAVRDNVKSRHIAEKIGGILICEAPLYSDRINQYGLENGIFTEEDITYVCKYEIFKK